VKLTAPLFFSTYLGLLFLPSHPRTFAPSHFPTFLTFVPSHLPTFLTFVPSYLHTFLPSYFLLSHLPTFLPSHLHLQNNQIVARIAFYANSGVQFPEKAQDMVKPENMCFVSGMNTVFAYAGVVQGHFFIISSQYA